MALSSRISLSRSSCHVSLKMLSTAGKSQSVLAGETSGLVNPRRATYITSIAGTAFVSVGG